MIVLDIPRATPSLNTTRRMHWATLRRHKIWWQLEVRIALRNQDIFRVPTPERACVTIERHSTRELDPDNLVGGFKDLIDCLRAEKLIVNDDPAHLELVPRQLKGKPRTVITVEAA